MLEEWCSEPAPRTLPYVPRNLRQRVSWLLQSQLDEAIAAAKRAIAGTRDDKWDALQAHRRLWALPSLLLRAPIEGEEAKQGFAGALPRQRIIQARVQQMELGNWSLLLYEALLERDQQASHRRLQPRQLTQQEEEHRRFGMAARKARGGCLRSAAQLLLSASGRAPATDATVDKTWELTAMEPPPQQDRDDARHHAAATANRQKDAVVVSLRTVRASIRRLKPGAEPGLSGWRNGLWIDLLAQRQGAQTAHAWVNLWAAGRVTPEITDLWHRSWILPLEKTSGGIRPISLQEAAVKLIEKCLSDQLTKHIRIACGARQLGAGVPGGAQIALEALKAAIAHETTEEVVSTDINNAFGSIYREKVLRACADRCPQLLRYLLASWHDEGSLMFVMGPHGWATRRAQRGIPQGGPLSDKLFAIAFEDTLAISGLDGGARRLCYADDLTLWGPRGSCAPVWTNLIETCAQAGLQMNVSKCHAWRPKDTGATDEVVPGVPAEPFLVVLGSEIHGDLSIALGDVPVAKPAEDRADKACKLAEATVRMGLSCADDRGVHAAFALLQRVVSPALEWDLRAAALGEVQPPADRLDTAITSGLRELFGVDMTAPQTLQAQLPADLGGLAMRMPGRQGAAALAKWAALSAALPEAKRLCEELEYDTQWLDANQELARASAELTDLGLAEDPSGPTLSEEAVRQVRECSCTSVIYDHEMLKHQAEPPQDRSRLQGKGGKLLDLYRLAAAWATLPTEQQEAVDSQTGPGEGTLFGDLSSDEREGWLQDHHFTHAVLARLGAPVCAPGHFCSLRTASGPRAGQVCQQPLDRAGRHLAPCRAGGLATRLHHALRRRLTLSLSEQSLRAEEEIVLPELTQITPSGIKEGRMDIVVSRPGGVARILIDVATCDGRASRCTDTEAAFRNAEREKHQRYQQKAWAFGVEHRGRLNRYAVEILEVLAREAVLLRGGRPATLVRRWRRQLQLVTAFEVAEVMRCQLCGLEDAARQGEQLAVLPGLKAVLDDATLGRIEEHRIRAIERREQRRAQHLDLPPSPPPSLVEDDDVFSFGGNIEDSDRAEEGPGSLPPSAQLPSVQSGAGDSPQPVCGRAGNSLPEAWSGAGSSTGASEVACALPPVCTQGEQVPVEGTAATVAPCRQVPVDGTASTPA